MSLWPLRDLLLWDVPRGSLPYDLVCLLILALLLLVPASWWGDPMLAGGIR